MCLQKKRFHSVLFVKNLEPAFTWNPSFSTFEFKTSSVSLCVIDDCKDADVPILDFTMNHLHLSHKVAGSGRATALLSGMFKFFK
jgi:hypothetical protein